MALENLGIEHEVVGITEIDKFAIKSYEAIHGEVNNLGDISLVDPNDVPDHDLFTYSFPCTDISLSGKGKGFEKGSGTRSGLLWECEKVIRAKKPKYLLLENVKNLVSKKFKPGFEKWLDVLEDIGYKNYYSVLNAKDYGVPQDRKRVFCVSILGDEHFDFDELEIKEIQDVNDFLEKEVNDRYTITQPSMLSKINVTGVRVLRPVTDYVWTITTKQLRCPNSGIIDIGDGQYRLLTPKECWRLMGISDDDFEKAAYESRKIIFKGGNESWNVKLADATESQTHENMETFALNITKDLKGQEEILTEWIHSLKMPENEKEQNVNVVIEKLGELAHSDSATSIIRCTDYMESLTILMGEKDPLHTVIIELDPKVSTNTAKYMKITSEESLNPLKLSIILTLIERITESKIFTSTLRNVNICGHISVTENLLSNTENQIELSLKTEAMFTRVSASQLYKQAGNAIVVDVLEAIFKNMFK